MNSKPRGAAFFNLLTLLTLAATGCVLAAMAAAFLVPGAVPAFLLAATQPPQVSVLTPPPPTSAAPGYPTLPPEWTATASPPPSPTVPTPTPNPFASATPTGVLGGQPTGLPNLNGTAQAGTDARVSATVATLRIRALAGTAGTIITSVPALTPLRVIGRIPDNSWLQVLTPQGTQGWAQAEFMDVYVDLLGVPITAGAALQATATAPGPTEPVDASIKVEGNHLRLRSAPGTAGPVLSFLPALMTMHLIGRTADNIWLQVITADKQQGWVLAQFITVYIGLDRIPVTGTAVNAPPATGTAPIGAVGPTNIAFVPSPLPSPLRASTSPPSSTPLPTATPLPPNPTTLPPTNPPPAGYDHPLPYLSGVSDHARQIYLAGLAAGNQPNVFSKIGDSITVAPTFLVPFGWGTFNLRDQGYLADVINYYAGGWARNGNAFNNVSLAAKGGWSSFNVLSPSQADHTLCRAGEPPLWCEYRLSRPSVALIMLGTNDVMDTSSDAYRANLERIVGDSLSRGIVPVLSTIPAFHRAGYEARVAELNSVITDVARENDIPLWDYWAAMENLPNEGLGPDGIHPSAGPNSADFTADNLQFGYTVRNLTALQALDALWHLEFY